MGRAVLDPAAVAAVEIGGGTLDDRVALGDLVQAGWSRTEWERRDDGSAAIEVSKAFASVDEVTGIVAELSGPSGPIREASATRDASWFSTTTKFDAVLDLPGSDLGVENDAVLAERLRAIGVDPAVVDATLTGRTQDALTLHLAVELPDGVGDVWTAPTDRQASAHAASTTRDLRRIALVVVAGACVLLAVYLLVVGERRTARRRSRMAVTPRS